MSFLLKGQLTTNNRKLTHMFIIPFPVCAYAAINYINGRRLNNILLVGRSVDN